MYLSKVRTANPKIKRLRELIHKHYRFYNDGDAFTISGIRVKSTPYGRRLSHYELEETNKGLHLLEDTIEKLTLQILTLTADERRRPTDQYGRVFRHPQNVPGFMDI